MKICQITPFFPLVLNGNPVFCPSFGGVERFVFDLVVSLKEIGHDVSVVTSNFCSSSSDSRDGLKVKRLFTLFNFYNAPFCPSLVFKLREITADIIHVHMPPFFFADFVSFSKKLRLSQLPGILSFHLHTENAPPLVSLISNVRNKLIGHYVFNSFSRIIVPTKTYRDLLIKNFNIDFRKIDVIPIGVNLDFYDPEKFDRKKIRNKYGLVGRKVALFVGRMDAQGSRQKGLEYLLGAIPKVVKKCGDVKFLIGGGGDQLGYFRKLSEALGIESYVEFLGYFPYNENPSLFSIADLVVLPTLYESFGLVLCEAMAMGKPVVATRIPSVMEVVEDGKTGLLVEPRNPDQLADSMLRILFDEGFATKLGEEGRSRVKEKFSWERTMEGILKVYENSSVCH